VGAGAGSWARSSTTWMGWTAWGSGATEGMRKGPEND